MVDPAGERGSRWGSLLAVLAIVGITAFTFGADLLVREQEPAEVPERVPSLRSTGASIAVFEPSARMTVIKFWSAACDQCLDEIRPLSATAEAFPEVRFVAAATDIDPTEARARSAAIAPEIAVVHDADRALAAGLEVSSVPATVVVGPNREVLRQFNGLTDAALRTQLEQLAGDEP